MFRRVSLFLVLMVAGCGTAGPADTGVPATTAVSVISTTTTTLPTTTTMSPTPDDGFPVTIATGGGDVVINQRPQAIVSLSPTATEMLFAVGAGDQVVAVDEYSTYPIEAPITDLSGFIPNFEAIAGYGPDLVIVSNDIEDIVATLGALDIPVLLMPAGATIDDTFSQMEQIGAATGHLAEAVAATGSLQQELDEIVASLPTVNLSFYHELDPTFYSITSSTFVGQIYSLLGLENIADPADTDGFGYPQLSVEHIVSSNPDLIFVTDCCGESLETIAARPGWENITAVQAGSVIVVDDDIASRWGPRTIEYLRTVAEAVAASVVVGG